ncbi:MAG: isoleucine--tRNA ligase [Candidatus Aenigmatarchaeota archaeon]
MADKQYEPQSLEAEVTGFWERQQIMSKLKAAKAKGKKFYLLDGPPYINDMPHVGTAKTMVVKDIWARLKTMQGFDVWLQPGFDTHGLPIETKVEAELGFKAKSDIEKFGVDKFISACYRKVQGNEAGWMAELKRIGSLRGWFDPYITYRPEYIESGWWTIKRLHDKGLLAEGERPIHWCPRCETSLSGYEVTDSYRDMQGPGVYIKFPVVGEANTFLLVYTTTPWTLFGNVAIAVHPREQYVKAKVGDEILIIAEARAKPVLEDMAGLTFTVIEKLPGSRLDGLKYHPLFDVPVQKGLPETAHRVILSVPAQKYKKYKKHRLGGADERKDEEEFAEFVTVDEGTGLVHTAPGHGASDWEMGRHYELPIVSPVDEAGKFTEQAGRWAGKHVMDANGEIMNELRERNLLFFNSTITHSYPVCWRCKTPLIFRNSKQWFFRIGPIKDMMIEENGKVKWLPDFAGKRFHNWLIDSVDWNVSQQRYWGIPLPIWVCQTCGEKRVIGSVKELKAMSIGRLPEELDLHRQVVDRIRLRCNCGGEAKRIPEITTVWFDSGIAPWASMGYPHKNKETFEKLWPVDFVTESQDQIRGWFYYLMFMGVATFDTSPYRSVGMLGWVLDEKGEKMSKSVGNVVLLKDAIEKLGADALRLYYAWEVAPWETQNFSFRTAEEIRRTLNILWNVFAYFKEYSAAAKWKPGKSLPRITRPEDLWILSKINSLVGTITGALEKGELHVAGRSLTNFITEDLSRWWLKLSKERTKPGSSDNAAFAVLDYTLNVLVRLLAPICPFMTEKIWRELFAGRERKESILLSEWPEPETKWLDLKLEERMETAKSVVEAAAAARSVEGIQLRRELPALTVSGGKDVISAVRALGGIIAMLCNVEKVRTGTAKVDVTVKPNWSAAGKKYGAKVQELAQALAKVDAVKLKAQLQKDGKVVAGNFTVTEDDIVFTEIATAKGAQFRGGTVFLDTRVNEELKHRWLLRELVRAVQEKRKELGLRVTDKVCLYLPDPSFKKFSKPLEKQTGSRIMIGKMSGSFGSIEFEGKKYEFGVEKK